MLTAAVWGAAFALMFLVFVFGPGVAAFLCGPGLLFVVSLAIAGEGNRWLWSAVFPLLVGLLGLGAYGFRATLPGEPTWLAPAIAFAGLPILPSLVLFAAWKVREVRTPKDALP